MNRTTLSCCCLLLISCILQSATSTVDVRGDQLYLLSEGVVNKRHEEGKQFCASLGGRLPSKLRDGDAAFYLSLMRRNKHQYGIWLDVTYVNNSYFWSTSDGHSEIVSANLWAPKEPFCRHEHCSVGLFYKDPPLMLAHEPHRVARVLCVFDMTNYESIVLLHQSLHTLNVQDQNEIRLRFKPSLALTSQVGLFMRDMNNQMQLVKQEVMDVASIRQGLEETRSRMGPWLEKSLSEPTDESGVGRSRDDDKDGETADHLWIKIQELEAKLDKILNKLDP